MTLETGIYIISSKSNDLYIGRNFHEDFSLRPKPVVTLPVGIQAPKWIVVKLLDGAYKLSTLGGHATEIDERVLAVLLPEPAPTEWTIKLRENLGPNVYTIQAPSGKGWVVPEENSATQIIVRHLIVGPSEPPHFPSNQLFTFVRIDRE